MKDTLIINYQEVECLKCNNRYTEKDNEFIKVCYYCGNVNVLETIYVMPEEED